MSYAHILLIAVGLAADAFAVSVAEGIVLHKVTHGHMLRIALHFGAFQAFMPVVGWLAGSSLRHFIAAWDHWIAFVLLTGIGIKMLADTILGFETGEPRYPSRGFRLIFLSVATSVDALAIGISLAMLGVGIWEPAVMIGLVTGILCAVGIQAGDRIGRGLGRWAELLGGTVLCLTGVRVLVEHLFGGGGGAP